MKKISLSNFILLIFSFQLLSHVARSQNSDPSVISDLVKTLEQGYSNDFAFSIQVEINGDLILSENFGYVDKENQVPVDEKTLFNIASITKSMTAVGIMKLVESKEISLTSTLEEFFKDVAPDKKKISVATLLSHKSGLKQNYPLEGVTNSREAFRIINDEKLESDPGSQFRYSNQNYQLLALIIEEVSGVSFEEFIKNEVFLPLEMMDTFFWDEVSDIDNLAPINKKIAKQIGKRNWAWIGATGVFSTTADLMKFWKGVNSDELLSKESYNHLFGNYFETASGLQVGYGFFKTPNSKWNTPELWTRGNESWGHNSVIRHFPEQKTTIVVSTNSGEFGKDKTTGNKLISDLIADTLFE